jgi:hypothetical protein
MGQSETKTNKLSLGFRPERLCRRSVRQRRPQGHFGHRRRHHPVACANRYCRGAHHATCRLLGRDQGLWSERDHIGRGRDGWAQQHAKPERDNGGVQKFGRRRGLSGGLCLHDSSGANRGVFLDDPVLT